MALIQNLTQFSHCVEAGTNPEIKKLLTEIRSAQETGKISQNVAVFPGFCDVHVHLREPGQTYKETIATGTAACARGGFTTVGAMPNLDPVPDSLETLALEQAAIKANALIETIPYAAVTKKEEGAELSDITALAPYVIGFSDDGHGVDRGALMRQALRLLADEESIVAVHAEDGAVRPENSCINAGPFAKKHGLIGIPKAAEFRQIARDIQMLRELKADGITPKYHVCHISCGESAQLIRQARAEGLNVTCETAMHYLLVDESMLEDDGRFKMNPPLREPEDRAALIAALIDGTIDMIATDHAPHSAEEKTRGLQDSAFGVVGVEISFPLFYTYFVKPGKISLERAIELFASAGRNRFHVPARENDFTIWDLDAEYEIDPAQFLSLGKATPFAGWEVSAKCLATIYDGNLVYKSVGDV
ncbi:dihydroorotase [Arcanobacterium hippocoleae]